LITAEAAPARFLIRVSADAVVIEPHDTAFGTRVTVNWLTNDVRRRVRGGRRQALGPAMGLHRRHDPRIFDATAGSGRDGFVLAALGARVLLCERSRTMYALLYEARLQAGRDPWGREASERIEPVHGDSIRLLEEGAAAFD